MTKSSASSEERILICPFPFEGENFFRILGFLLSCREHGKDTQHAEERAKTPGFKHASFYINEHFLPSLVSVTSGCIGAKIPGTSHGVVSGEAMFQQLTKAGPQPVSDAL